MNKVTSEVATRQQSSVDLNKKLKSAIRTIDRKLAALGIPSEFPKMQTNGTFKMNENDNNNINIHTFQNSAYLISALGKMKRLKREYEEQMLELGIETAPVLLWCNHTIDAWIHDLTIRAKIVANQVTINELNKAKQELTTFLSQEDRLESTLTNLSKLLK